MLESMRLQGRQVSIRSVTWEDLPTICKWWNDPSVMREVRAEKFSITLEQLKERYWPVWRNPRPDQFHEFVICLRNRVIGEIGYQFADIDQAVASVDIKIGEPALWGQGLGTEAMKLLVSYLFKTIKAERVIGQPGDWNVRSMRLLEKCGFVEVNREDIPATEIHDGGVMVTMVLDHEHFVEDQESYPGNLKASPIGGV